MAEVARRRGKDRPATEEDILNAAWKLFERDGVLSGINLNEVASVANANRASIYHYFGSRDGLLRAAIGRRLKELRPTWLEDRRLPFVKRRLHAFDVVAGGEPTLVRLVVLLILEGTNPFDPLLLDLDRARESLIQDVETGDLPPNSDLELVHIMPWASYIGYALVRELVSEELGIEPTELDARARPVYEAMLKGLVTAQGRESSPDV
jgi:AcrR family transcriptional regulator